MPDSPRRERGLGAAVVDHHRAVLSALAAKAVIGRRVSAADDTVGGTTLSYDIWRGHPKEQEVLELLSVTRKRLIALWNDVEDYNRAHGLKDAYQVSFYCRTSTQANYDDRSRCAALASEPLAPFAPPNRRQTPPTPIGTQTFCLHDCLKRIANVVLRPWTSFSRRAGRASLIACGCQRSSANRTTSRRCSLGRIRAGRPGGGSCRRRQRAPGCAEAGF